MTKKVDCSYLTILTDGKQMAWKLEKIEEVISD